MVYSSLFSKLRTSVPEETHCMTPARGENADSKLYPFPADEGFEKFQKLNFYHLLKGKIHLIVNDKLLILLAACNSSGS